MNLELEQFLNENKKLSGVLSECPFSIAIYKADGTPDFANKALNKLWNVDEATSQYLLQHYNLLHDEQLKNNGQMEFILNALKGEITWIPPIKYDFTQTSEIQNTNLRIFWVRSVIYPVFNDKKEVTHLVLMSEDFTERMDFEENLRHFNEILTKRVEEEVANSKRKDEIIAEQSRMAAIVDTLGVISHHWRQPLNSLHWLIQDLEYAYEQDEVNKDYIEQMMTHSKELIHQMSEIINDFRKYLSKPEQDNFYLKEFLKNDIENFIIEQTKNNKQIQLFFSGEDNFKVFGSKDAFIRILRSLLENAIGVLRERNVEEGKIFISTISYLERREVIIQIEDNGGGISDKNFKKIFDPYFSTKKEKNGHGLGLFMAKMIVEKNMDGSLSVTNSKNGAVFSIQLRIIE